MLALFLDCGISIIIDCGTLPSRKGGLSFLDNQADLPLDSWYLRS